MITRNRLLPLLLALLVSTAHARTRGLSHEKPSLRERPARQAMESIVQLAERRECVPFSEVTNISIEARYAQLQEGCSPEACSGATSCCRVLGTGLVCDTDNKYPFSACVCNDFTRTRSPTRAPSSAPPPAPTSNSGNTGGDTGGDSGSTGGNTGGDTGGNTGGDNGSTGGNTGSTGGDTGSTGGDTGGNTGSTGGNNDGSTGGNTGSTGGNNDGSTGGNTGGDSANVGNTDNTNADTSGNTDGDFNQVNKETETIPDDDDKWWMDPVLMGSVGAGVLVLCVGVLMLTHKFRKETSPRRSRQVKALAWDADASTSSPRLEQHVELESVQSDYELNELPPDEESTTHSQSQQQKDDKCCQVQACNDFGSWMDNICAPKRARSYETKDTVNL